VARLRDADLERPVGHGWTVATSLVHLAFWDLRAIALLDRFEREGVGPSPEDADAINDALQGVAAVVPPRAAARLAVEAAERIDRRLETAADGVLEGIPAAGHPFNLTRHRHRLEHCEEIERALG
jgi:hypothetical protein